MVLNQYGPVIDSVAVKKDTTKQPVLKVRSMFTRLFISSLTENVSSSSMGVAGLAVSFFRKPVKNTCKIRITRETK